MKNLLQMRPEVVYEILKEAGEDITNTEVLNVRLDVYSTLENRQSPNGDMARLLIAYENDFKIRVKTFLVRSPVASRLYNLLYVTDVFKKEYLLYSKVFPMMRELHNEPITAKFYLGDDSPLVNTLVIEDLYWLGYEKKPKPLDLHHSDLTMKCLAKFHASSVKLDKDGKFPKQLKLLYFKFMPVNLPANSFREQDLIDNVENLKLYYNGSICQLIDKLDESLKKKYSEKLHLLKDNIADHIINQGKGCFKVLTHGNLWHDNILFKYTKKNAEKAAFLNFEGARWSCAVYDIIYFTLTSMKFEDFQQHSETLYNTYVNTLNDMLRSFGIESTYAYTTENLKKDFHNKYAYIIYVLAVILPLVDVPDVNQAELTLLASRREDIKNPETKYYEDETYKSVMTKWFQYFAENGTFDDIQGLQKKQQLPSSQNAPKKQDSQ